MPTVKEIVTEYLKAHGFTGLYQDNACGCTLDCLMDCGGNQDMCEPGYKQPDPEAEEDWVVGPKPWPPNDPIADAVQVEPTYPKEGDQSEH